MTISDALAAGRRQAGMTVTQVSQRTCIRETIIRSIERGDFSGCGGDFYARGHIRSIARAVGVDPEPLIDEYDSTMGAPRAISAADVFQPVTPVRLKERRKPNWTAALTLALVLALSAFAYLRFHHSSTPPRPVNDAGAITRPDHHSKVSHTPAAIVAPPRPHRLDIKITATQNSWVVLTSLHSGRTIFTGMVYAGQSLQWSERSSVSLQVDNPAGVIVTVNGSRNKIHRGTTRPINLTLALGPPKAAGKHA